MIDPMWSLLFFMLGGFMGMGVGTMFILFLIGPSARTLGVSRLNGKPIAIQPHLNRTMEIKRVHKGIAEGQVMIPSGRRNIVVKINPKNVYLMDGRVSTNIVPDKIGTGVTPEDAQLATIKENGKEVVDEELRPILSEAGIRDGAKINETHLQKFFTAITKRSNLSFEALSRQIRSVFSPAELAMQMKLYADAHKEIINPEKGKMSGFNLLIILAIGAFAVIGLLLAKKMGWI